jgi:hypothetical protein
MMYEPVKFSYTMNVKLNYVNGKTLVNCVFPHVEDLVLSSKRFDTLENAIKSATDLNSEVVQSLNAAVREDRFGLFSEVNPKHSNEKALSVEWASNEIAKIWIIDKIQHKANPGPIKAVGLAQIIEVLDPPTTLN